MKEQSKLNFIVILLCGILAACGPLGKNPTSTPTPSLVVASATPYSIATPTMRPTVTWLPPLPAEEAEIEVIKLLRDNGGCRLPCFLGIAPQDTTYQTFTSFMYQFVNIRKGGLMLPGTNSTVEIFVTMKSSEDPFAPIRSLEVSMSSYEPERGEPFYVFDDPLFVEFMQYYSLPSILTNYGPPSQAFIRLAPGEMGTDDIFHIILDYPEIGWRVDYWMPFNQDGDNYLGCPSQAFAAFALWEPGDTDVAKETERWFRYFFSPPIDEATDLSIDEFYQQFKAPNYDECLETPISIWQ